MNEIKILENLLLRYPLLQAQKENIWNAYRIMAESFAHGKKLLIAGNGGSAADAEHIAGELMKGFIKKRRLPEDIISGMEKSAPGMGRIVGENLQQALPAVAVTGHPALSTACANDQHPLLSFAQQVYGYGSEDDVFLAVSTSGNSENILNACIAARAKKMRIIGLTGKGGGRLKALADAVVIVPGEEAYQIQELHVPVYHCLCLMLEEHFFTA